MTDDERSSHPPGAAAAAARSAPGVARVARIEAVRAIATSPTTFEVLLSLDGGGCVQWLLTLAALRTLVETCDRADAALGQPDRAH